MKYDYIINNDRVDKIQKIGSSTIKSSHPINKIEVSVENGYKVGRWTKFNPETNIWEIDSTNKNPYQINKDTLLELDDEGKFILYKLPELEIKPSETELLRNEVSDLKSQLSELIAFLRGG